MSSAIGVTLAKVNSIFAVRVTNATWDVKRDVAQIKTGGGIEIATGLAACSGSFDEIVPIGGPIDLTSLSAFSIQIYDQATQKILLFAAQNCEWEDISGSSAVEGANTRRKWTWKGQTFTKT